MGRKSAKHLNRIKKSDDALFTGSSSDIIIPVMGPTGVGKSTFINSLDRSQVRTKVAHGLESGTNQLLPIAIPLGSGQNAFKIPNGVNPRRLILVDTPGFDDTYVSDADILRRISVWLAESYNNDMKLAGVIYLHDITQTRMLGSTRRNLDIFQKLVGQDAMRRVVLGTTKWGLLKESAVGNQRQKQLKTAFWNDMINVGSRVVEINSRDAPRGLVQLILDQITQSQADSELLAIQNELVKMEKFIPETEAGKALKYTIKETLELQKQKGNNQELLAKLEKLTKELKVPLSDRIKRFFG